VVRLAYIWRYILAFVAFGGSHAGVDDVIADVAQSAREGANYLLKSAGAGLSGVIVLERALTFSQSRSAATV
jgi:hypothetical protein